MIEKFRTIWDEKRAFAIILTALPKAFNYIQQGLLMVR